MATFTKQIKETLNHEASEEPKGVPISDTTIADTKEGEEKIVEETTTVEGATETEGEENSEPIAAEAEVEEVEAEAVEAEAAEEATEPIVETVSDPLRESSNPLGEPASMNEPAASPLGESIAPFAANEILIDATSIVSMDESGISISFNDPAETIDYNAIMAENKALKSEVESLRAFKAAAEKAELDAKVATLVEDFSDLPKEEVENIVKNEFNYENIELKLYALRGRLNTKTPARAIQTYAISDSMLKQDEPSWVSIVKNYKNKKSTEGGY